MKQTNNTAQQAIAGYHSISQPDRIKSVVAGVRIVIGGNNACRSITNTFNFVEYRLHSL